MIAPDQAATDARDALAKVTTITITGDTAATHTNTDDKDAVMTTDVTVDTTPDATTPEAAPVPEVKADEMPRYVAVSMTKELWDAIQENMPANTPTGTYLRDIVAAKLGVTVVTKTRSKYDSPEAKEAAQKVARVERAELIKKLLAAHKAEQLAAAATTPTAE